MAGLSLLLYVVIGLSYHGNWGDGVWRGGDSWGTKGSAEYTNLSTLGCVSGTVSGCHRPVDRSSLEGSSLSGLTRGGCRPSWRGRQGHGKLEAASHISLTVRKKRDACRCPLPIFIMCVYVFEHVYACPCAYRHPQKPEEGVCWSTCEHFQAVMNRLMWVLGTGLWSSIKSSKLSHLSRPHFLLLI